jgi:hypothetical protein
MMKGAHAYIQEQRGACNICSRLILLHCNIHWNLPYNPYYINMLIMQSMLYDF